MEVTERALYKGIEQLHDGKRLGDLGSAVQQVAEGAGFSVVRAFVGHATGVMCPCHIEMGLGSENPVAERFTG